MKTINQSRIFISYSHQGNGLVWKEGLLTKLSVFEQQHLIDPWHDDEMKLGDNWYDQINASMGSARLAVLLLTDEFLKSPFVLQHELPELERRHKVDGLIIAPILCEKCDWETNSWLASLQIKPRENATPVPLVSLSQSNRDHALRKLATEIAMDLGENALAEISKLRSGDLSTSEVKIYLDRFPLTRSPGQREEKLIGREQELALLNLAFAQPHTAIVSLVAWGGVGKTVLVQHWLKQLQSEGWFGARRIYAWSFYSQGTKEDRQASEDTFLAHALAWFGVQCEPTLSPWDKGRLLADAVAREHTLLILDGIEPLQYPPGPMGGQLRAPGVQSLLKQLARKSSDLHSQPSTLNQALCLVTTREPLTDLTDFQRRGDSLWGSVLRMDLGNLTLEAGATLLHQVGANRAGAMEIRPDDKELLAASREVDGHALTLNLLGRFLARAHGGDIRRRDLVRFEEADRKEQGGTTFKMLATFEKWFAKSGEFGARQLAVLRILGLFDRPADAGCIAALRNPPMIAGLTEPLFHSKGGFLGWGKEIQAISDEDWNTATSFLADFDLVEIQATSDSDKRSLDCHPLVREYFGRQLSARKGSQSAHRRIFDHLIITTPVQEQPTLDELQPLYQAVYHGCKAGNHAATLHEVYVKRICKGRSHYSWHVLYAYGTDTVALCCFFSIPWIEVEKTLSPEDQALVFNEASFCLRAVGRTAESVKPVEMSVTIFDKLGKSDSAASTAGNAAEVHLALGDIPAAEKFAAWATNLASRSDQRWMIVSQAIYAAIRHAAGHSEEAASIFSKTEFLQSLINPGAKYIVPPQGFHYCEFILDLVERPIWCLTIRTLTTSGEIESQSFKNKCQDVQIRAGTYLSMIHAHPFAKGGSGLHRESGLAHIMGARSAICQSYHERDQSKARSYVNAAKKDMRIGLLELRLGSETEDLALGLCWNARLRYLENDAVGAQADLDEAWDIAERGPMRLHLADIHLHRARLFFREKPYPWESPQADLAAAEKLINDCGYHRRDEELADAKRFILGV